MLSKATLFVTASLAVFAIAVPTGSKGAGQCNTGPVQCCQTLSKSGSAGGLQGLLGIVTSLTALTGTGCSPFLGIGANCATQTVCCENNQFNGLIVFGCSPIAL